MLLSREEVIELIYSNHSNNIGKWFRCPNCSNYSLTPMECCGENMVEEHEEEVENESLIIVYDDDF
ncbi:MAG: hypothetical protein UT28_C0001G0217 [Berkelbacteria bacterium GW2011_GWE1_39_12]|uniref:Uncharacterized protein n=1 Tax=Berkelbacteria bacterium GW2011_GWE1_39_12 TaxID=1618337 RepID=A0A0G4B3N1_9BACT|nr:MAG: hypothetical protein UT28_C0001G0217 [Berkelbacteria bacterium GW2011_GWE1_39_12]